MARFKDALAGKIESQPPSPPPSTQQNMTVPWRLILESARQHDAEVWDILSNLQQLGAEVIELADRGALRLELRPGRMRQDEYDWFKVKLLRPRVNQVIAVLDVAARALVKFRHDLAQRNPATVQVATASGETAGQTVAQQTVVAAGVVTVASMAEATAAQQQEQPVQGQLFPGATRRWG